MKIEKLNYGFLITIKSLNLKVYAPTLERAFNDAWKSIA